MSDSKRERKVDNELILKLFPYLIRMQMAYYVLCVGKGK